MVISSLGLCKRLPGFSSSVLKVTSLPCSAPHPPTPTSLQALNGCLCAAGSSPHCLSSIQGLPPCLCQSHWLHSQLLQHWEATGFPNRACLLSCPYLSAPTSPAGSDATVSVPTPGFHCPVSVKSPHSALLCREGSSLGWEWSERPRDFIPTPRLP